jgi:erythrocyte band 7 integral membrane protein
MISHFLLMGRNGGVCGPGIFILLPCIDSYVKVDMRVVTFDVPPQEVLSKDFVTIAVDAVVYYKIFDPLKTVISVQNYATSTRLLASTTLRNILGTRTYSEILSEREEISRAIRLMLDEVSCSKKFKIQQQVSHRILNLNL